MDEATREVNLHAMAGSQQLYQQQKITLGRLSAKQGLVASCITSGQIMNIRDVKHDIRFVPTFDTIPRFPTETMLLVPLQWPHHRQGDDKLRRSPSRVGAPLSQTSNQISLKQVEDARGDEEELDELLLMQAQYEKEQECSEDTMSTAPRVTSIFDNYLTMPLYHSLPDPHVRGVRVPLPTFAHYETPRMGWPSLPRYIRQTAVAADREIARGASIKASAVLVLINKEENADQLLSRRAMPFNSVDETMMAMLSSFVSQLQFSAHMSDVYAREREKTRSLLLGTDALCRAADLRALLSNIAQAIRISMAADYCVIWGKDEEASEPELFCAGLDCNSGLILRIPNSYVRTKASDATAALKSPVSHQSPMRMKKADLASQLVSDAPGLSRQISSVSTGFHFDFNSSTLTRQKSNQSSTSSDEMVLEGGPKPDRRHFRQAAMLGGFTGSQLTSATYAPDKTEDEDFSGFKDPLRMSLAIPSLASQSALTGKAFRIRDTPTTVQFNPALDEYLFEVLIHSTDSSTNILIY